MRRPSFAPGTYTLREVDGDHMLTLRDSAHQPGRRTEECEAGYLAFRTYGKRHFLAEYHPANSANSIDLSESGKERRVAKDFAMNGTDPGRVQLALNDGDWIR
jgi:hypothetical protein